MKKREHFLTLDFLRGVAAIAVFMHHWGIWSSANLFGQGFFAVDFFFVLSGFVIAYAYDSRLQGSMNFGDSYAT